MGTLSELMAKTDMIEKAFAPDEELLELASRPDLRLLKVREQLGRLMGDHQSMRELNGPDSFSAMILKRKMGQEAADVLCDLLLFMKQNEIDLDSALEEKWFRQLSNRCG